MIRRSSNWLSTSYNFQKTEDLTLCIPERPIPIISCLIRIIFGLIRIIFFSSADQVWIDRDHRFFPPDQPWFDADHLFLSSGSTLD